MVFDIVLVTLGLANAAGLGYLAYAIARSREDTPTLVAEAVDDAVKRQDDIVVANPQKPLRIVRNPHGGGGAFPSSLR